MKESQIATETRLREAVRAKSAREWRVLIKRNVKDRLVRGWCACAVFWRLSDYEGAKDPGLLKLMDGYKSAHNLDEALLCEALDKLGLSDARAPKRYEPSKQARSRGTYRADGRVSHGYRHGQKASYAS